MAICNKTGAIAIYNEAKNLFLSPYADGPIQFSTNPNGTQNIKNLSKFGRSFSILRVPYSLKLLIQELQVMNVQMRIITDDNVDQLLNMSYSNNINKLLDIKSDEDIRLVTREYTKTIKEIAYKEQATVNRQQQKGSINESPVIPEPIALEEIDKISSPVYVPGSPAYVPGSPAYVPGSPAYVPGSPAYVTGEPAYVPPNVPGSPAYSPSEPVQAPGSPYNPTFSAPGSPYNPTGLPDYPVGSPYNPSDPSVYKQPVYNQNTPTSAQSSPYYPTGKPDYPITNAVDLKQSILDVESDKAKNKDTEEKDTTSTESGNTKTIKLPEESSSSSSSSDSKKITL
jgi:hypothetical protein